MFDNEPISSFVFTTESTTQTFHHQWIEKGKLHECKTCYSRIDADEPPSQHWLLGGQEANKLLQLTMQQQAVLDIIEARQIRTFFFCDESAKDKLEHFMEDTCTKGMPELLRWMFHQHNTFSVEFNVACYVNVETQVLIFQSGNLQVEHHFDIEEGVSLVYQMLMQRIHNYLDTGLDECSITRLRIQVKRNLIEEGDLASKYALPLQLRQEATSSSSASMKSNPTSESELDSLKAAYLKHYRECQGYFPPNMRANLYGLQQCKTTKELFVVPYHISETLQQLPNKNFLILNNIVGEFQRLHELPTRLDDTTTLSPASATASVSLPSSTSSRSLQCRRCRAQFSRPSKLHIHQQLHCGQDFTVDSMHADIVEIYEQCLPISRNAFQYACYGITKPKTIMHKGQFVPIECDWRSESSVKVQHGPCVVISNAQHNSPSKLK